MHEHEDYLQRAIELKERPNKLSRLFPGTTERKLPKTPFEKAEEAARSCHPYFTEELMRWDLIGPGTTLLNSALIAESLTLPDDTKQLTPVETVFNHFFEPFMHNFDMQLKKWREISSKRGERDPNLKFELEWQPMYARYLDGKPIVFGLRMLSKPAYDHRNDRLVRVVNPSSTQTDHQSFL